MNRVILGLLLAVCVLGMALIMLNEKLRKPEHSPITQTIVTPQADAPHAGQPQEQPQVPGTVVPPHSTGVQNPMAGNTATPSLPPLPMESEQSLAPPAHAPLPDPIEHKARPAVTAEKSPEGAVAKPHVAPQKTPATASHAGEAAPAAAPATSAAPAQAAAEKPKTAGQETQKQATAPKTAPQKLEITNFVVFSREKGATVRLVGTAPITYTSMALTDPERLVIDINGKWQIKAPGVPKNPLVTNVRLGKFDTKTRVVIDLSGKPASTRYILSKDRQTLDIRVDK